MPTHNGSVVLPEIRVTPNRNYVYDSYDGNELEFANGGHLFAKGGNTGTHIAGQGWYTDLLNKYGAEYNAWKKENPNGTVQEFAEKVQNEILKANLKPVTVKAESGLTDYQRAQADRMNPADRSRYISDMRYRNKTGKSQFFKDLEAITIKATITIANDHYKFKQEHPIYKLGYDVTATGLQLAPHPIPKAIGYGLSAADGIEASINTVEDGINWNNAQDVATNAPWGGFDWMKPIEPYAKVALRSPVKKFIPFLPNLIEIGTDIYDIVNNEENGDEQKKYGGNLYHGGGNLLLKTMQKYADSGKTFDEVLNENKNIAMLFSPQMIEIARQRYNKQRSSKYGVSDDTLYDRLSSFRVAYEGFSPIIKGTQNTGDASQSDVLGYGMTFYINEDGSTRPFKKGETMTEDEASEQLDRYDRIYAPKELKKIGLTNIDRYPAELKFQLIEAMFNMRGTNSIIYKSSKDRRKSNYYTALLDYEKNKGWENSDYDYNQIFKHADWNGTSGGRLSLRSFMRQRPQYINWNDVTTNEELNNWPNTKIDSLRNVYKYDFQ